MALPRLPTLREVLERPDILGELPAPIAAHIVAQLKQVFAAAVGSGKDFANPIEMAITHPRYRWMDTPHLHYIADEIASVIDRHGATVLTMPPRHAKSHTASVWTPFWFLARWPDQQVLLISYEATFARKWGLKVRQLVEVYGREYNLELNPRKTAADDWELITGGGMKCVGVGGGISGNPAKLLIGDDLIKDYEQAHSQIIRENTWNWWDNTAVQRVEPDTTVILIGTRYHEDDIIGRALQHAAEGDGLPFTEITLRAKAEEDDALGRPIGEGLWINHPKTSGGVWGQDYYDRREASVSAYTWSSVYQQRPSPPGGNRVDPGWWRFYRPSELPELEQEAQSWDLALDAIKKTDSFNCGLIGGRRGAMVFLRDAYHKHGRIAAGVVGQAEPGRARDADTSVISTIRQWKRIYPGARTKLVERSLAGPLLISVYNQQVGGMIGWPPKGRQYGGNKETRLEACIPDIRAGNILLPLNPDGSKPKWVDEFIEEMRQFPNAPHDDYVDAFTQLLAFLLPGMFRSVDRDHIEAKQQTVGTVDAQTAHTAALHALLHKLADKKVDPIRKLQKRRERFNGLGDLGHGRLPTNLLSRLRSGRNRGLW